MIGGVKIPLIGALGAVNDTYTTQARPLLPWGWAEQVLPLETNRGAVAATLAGLTCVARGSQQYGSVAATLAGLTCQAQGSQQFGAVTATLAGLTCAAQGSHHVGTVTATLQGLTCQAAGTVVTFGTLAVTLAGLTCLATGNAGAVSGPVVATFAGLSCLALGLTGRELPYSYGDAAPARASPPSATGAEQVQLSIAGPSRVT